MLQLLVTANIPNSPILVTLMMEVMSSSKMSVLTRATWRNITEDDNLHLLCLQLSCIFSLKMDQFIHVSWGQKGIRQVKVNWTDRYIIISSNVDISQ
jgi:hypothetical protein